MTVTNNLSLTLPTVGGDSGAWGTELNNGVITPLDTALSSTQPISITSVDVTLTTTQWGNCIIRLTGALTGNRNLNLPLSANTTALAVGGFAIIDNQTTGAFNVTVKTAIATSSGVTVPQGLRTVIWSDGFNVAYAHDSSGVFRQTSGSPQGSVAGTAGTVANPPYPWVYDYTNQALYLPTTTGTAGSTVWTNIALLGGAVGMPQGYLTPTSGTPIITADVSNATVIYYTPYLGEWVPIHNGTQIIPYNFAEMSLTLTASQAALNIYDLFLAYNSGTPVIGTGPSWAASGGSITAGSCARGTGAGSTALDRTQGPLTNTNSMSLIWNTGGGNNTITVPANQGIYLGSIFINAGGGSVTCHRSFGQSRVWGLWNYYNRAPIVMTSGDTTANWTNTTGNWRASNGSAANTVQSFAGFAEEMIIASFTQVIAGAAALNTIPKIGIGQNSTSVPGGQQGQATVRLASISAWTATIAANLTIVPSLGINAINMLENCDSTGANFLGTQANMQMIVSYRG